MSYFDDASLVMIPSGYKDQKVYSVKPLDGSGDLTFSRASSATRVASNGLIEKVRTNVALYSQEFNNANWSPTNVTVTANTTAAPDGTTTADSLAFTASSSARTEGLTAASSPAGEITLSVYAKVASGTAAFRLRGDWSGGNSTSSNFTATTDWQRFTHTFTAASALQIMSIYNGTSGAAQTIIFWGAQAESGVATDYIATTSAAVSVGPVSGLPRLDYLNSTCPRLLLEPQRTNLALYSEQLTNAEYTADSASFTANAGSSPDGYTNADLLTENSSSATHGFYASVATRGTTGASLTTSIFAKSNGRRYINISGGFDSGNYYNAVFDLQNGVVSTTGNAGAGTSPVASIVSYGNGWYRCIVTGSVTGLNNRLSFVYLSNSATGNGVAGATYTGNGTSGAYFYGYQIEAAAYATSYIPTLGTSVTRVADAASKTGISSLIGQTEGTIFWEIDVNIQSASGNEQILTIDNGSTYDNSIYLAKGETGSIVGVIVSGAVIQAQFSVSKTTGTFKMALGYANNNSAFFVDGTQVTTTDTSCSIPASLSRITLGNTPLGPSAGGTRQFLLFPIRLSNSDLAALTA